MRTPAAKDEFLLWGERPNSLAIGLDHRDLPSQTLANLTYGFQHPTHPSGYRLPTERQNHQARHREAMSDCKLAKVEVLGNQNAVFSLRRRRGSLIGRSGIALEEVGDIVAHNSQSVHNLGGAAFVRQKPHLFCRNQAFVREVICSVGKGRTNVFLGDVRIALRDLLEGKTRRTLAHQQLDSDAGASDHRLSHHDLRVTMNAFVRHRDKITRRDATP